MKYSCLTADGDTSSPLRLKTKTSDKHCVSVYMHHACHASRFSHMWDHECPTSPSPCFSVISVETQIKPFIPTKEKQKLRWATIR